MQAALGGSQNNTSISTAQYVAEMQRALNDLPTQAIEALVTLLIQGAHEGRTVFLVGNGGSAATATHFACDLGKGTRKPLKPYCRVVALTDNASLITAWGNDL